MTIGHMIKCVFWTLKSSLDISVEGCQGSGPQHFPQVDQMKTESEEDDNLRYGRQADLNFFCFLAQEVFVHFGYKIQPTFNIIHSSLTSNGVNLIARAMTLISLQS